MNNKKMVILGVLIVDKLDPVPRDGAVIAAIFDLDPVPQHPVKRPVVGNQGRLVGPDDTAEGVFAGLFGNARIESVDGIPKTLDKQNIAKRLALGAGPFGRDLFAVSHAVAQSREPGQSRLFDR